MSRTSNAKTVDEYLEELPIQTRNCLQQIRKTILQTAPDATEVISYRMPAYKYHGMLIGFGAFKDHCSIFLWKKDSINHFKDELTDFSLSEGTIRFTIEKPIPTELVTKIVVFRMQENLDKKASKKRLSKK